MKNSAIKVAMIDKNCLKIKDRLMKSGTGRVEPAQDSTRDPRTDRSEIFQILLIMVRSEI